MNSNNTQNSGPGPRRSYSPRSSSASSRPASSGGFSKSPLSAHLDQKNLLLFLNQALKADQVLDPHLVVTQVLLTEQGLEQVLDQNLACLQEEALTVLLVQLELVEDMVALLLMALDLELVDLPEGLVVEAVEDLKKIALMNQCLSTKRPVLKKKSI
jgi:hypothetical protein